MPSSFHSAVTSASRRWVTRGLSIPLLLVVTCFWPLTVTGQTGTQFRPPQEVDGKRPNSLTPSKPAVPPPTAEAAQQQAEKMYQQLVQELYNLIPGDPASNPEQQKVIGEAVKAFQARDAKLVIELMTAQALSDPNFPPADVMLAGLSFAIQDPKSGRVLLERAALQHPDKPAVYSTFARLAINENRSTDALALLDKLERVTQNAKLSPVSAAFYEAQYLDGATDIAMRQRRFSDARRYLTRLRELRPGNPKALMVSAELEFNEKNLEQSLLFLKQLQTALPQTRPPEIIVANWFQRTGKFDTAKVWIQAAAETYADSPQVQLEVASWAVNEEQFPMANSAIKKAEVKGETPQSLSLKAKIAFAGESYGVAESHYGELYEKFPNNFDASNMYALCLIESDDPEKRKMALEIANRNVRALPNNVVAQAARGYILLREGKTEQAKTAIGRALQQQNASPEIRFFAASVLNAMEEKEKSKTTLEQALKYRGLFLYRARAKKMFEQLSN